MEPVTSTLLVTLAKIAGTGVLTRAAGNAFDAVSPKIQEFFGAIQNKLPADSPTAKALKAGQELDYDQVIIDVEPIEQDPEVIKLAAEIRSLIAQNQELQAKLNAEVAKIKPKNIQENQSGSHSNIQVNDKVETKYFAGIHYHGVKPD
jgi:hypothetical protein